MFAGPEKELLTIQCFSESAYPGKCFEQTSFLGIRMSVYPSHIGSHDGSANAIYESVLLESLTNLPREIFKNASFYFGLEQLSKSPPSIIPRYSDSSTTFSSF